MSRRRSRAEVVARHFHRQLIEGTSGKHFDDLEPETQRWWIGEAEDALATPLQERSPPSSAEPQ